MTQAPVHIQVVFGSKDADVIAKYLVPSLGRATHQPVIVWCLNYHDQTTRFSVPGNLEVHWIERKGEKPTGFGANHNRLFQARGTAEDFIIVNPDCVLLPESIDRLLERKNSCPNAAIVEGRQWPFEHPKEFDPQTFETPWASGAFALIRGSFFSDSGGFDESFFMYLEDVDLSWRAWLSGRAVIYEPEAVACHFSGGLFYRPDLRSGEEYFGSRNFLMLARKFFGEDGERRGIKIIRQKFPSQIARQIISDYRDHYRQRVHHTDKYPDHRWVKILDFNQFHEIRS